MSDLPTLDAIRATRARLGDLVVTTPVRVWDDPALARQLEPRTTVVLKAELFQRTGTFKPRGALSVMLDLPPEKLARGVTAVSAGNHAMAVAAMSMNRKSPGVAVLLSLLFTGAGQIYCGRAGRGIAFFAAAFCSALLIFFVIGIFMLLAIWIWAAIDAANLASRQNATLLAAMSGGG